MSRGARFSGRWLGLVLASALAAIVAAGCGAGSRAPGAAAAATTGTVPTPSVSTTTVTTTATTTTTATVTLPGAGKPPVTIGDENTPEQFLLGQLYYQALKAQGFAVQLNQSIGPTQVIMQALATGQLAMYPDYLDTWDRNAAGLSHSFSTRSDAYRAGQHFALAHGLKLLDTTPFSDTEAIATTFDYAVETQLQSIGDLLGVVSPLTLGGPPQFQQDSQGLPAIETTYGVNPVVFKPLEIGAQYQALDQGTVQAAVVNTTDPQLLSGSYPLLSDPEKVFGWGNVVPVASVQALNAEGPLFAETINRISSLLTLDAMREMNAQVMLYNQDPATVAQQFLQAQGILPVTPPTGG